MKYKLSRRDALKRIAGLPFLGYFANRLYVSQKTNVKIPKVDWSKYGISEYDPDILQIVQNKTNGEKFWARGYAVSTVGFEEAQIKEYIRHQENLDRTQSNN